MILEAFLIAALSAAAAAPTAAAPTRPPSSRARPKVSVQADRFEIAGKVKAATFVGHVRALRGSTHLTCDRLVAHYSEAQEITRIECIGKVEARDGDKWAKGDRADFDNTTGILEVTGSPEAQQGPNHMVGSKVVFDIEKDTITVTDARVEMVTPDEGLKPKPGPKPHPAPGARPAAGGPGKAP